MQHFGRGGIAIVRVDLHGVHGDLLDAAGDPLDQLAGRRCAAVDVLDGHGHRRFAVVGCTAGQHLIHDDAEGIQVAAAVHMAALGLLRGDIVYGAERLARQRVLRGADAGNAEVRNLDAPVLQDHDVVRLDVAVDDAAAVCMLQRLGDLHGEMQRLAPVEPALLFQILLERDALDQFHDNIVHIAGAGNIIHTDDIRVRQHRDRLRLGMETSAELLIAGEFIFQNFDCDQPVQPVAQCFIYDRHSAGADHFQDLVAIIQQSAYVIIHIYSYPLFVLVGERRPKYPPLRSGKLY